MSGDKITTSARVDRFEEAVTEVLRREGGFVDHKADKGGATNYGISLRFALAEGRVDRNRDGFADLDLDMDGDIDGADIRALAVGDAKALYRRCFWDRYGCAALTPPLDGMIFDQAVNGGGLAAIRMLQRVLNDLGASPPLLPDGQLGPRSHFAVQQLIRTPGIGLARIVLRYREEVKRRYRAIAAADPSQKVFLAGWLNRADRLGHA